MPESLLCQIRDELIIPRFWITGDKCRYMTEIVYTLQNGERAKLLQLDLSTDLTPEEKELLSSQEEGTIEDT